MKDSEQILTVLEPLLYFAGSFATGLNHLLSKSEVPKESRIQVYLEHGERIIRVESDLLFTHHSGSISYDDLRRTLWKEVYNIYCRCFELQTSQEELESLSTWVIGDLDRRVSLLVQKKLKDKL